MPRWFDGGECGGGMQSICVPPPLIPESHLNAEPNPELRLRPGMYASVELHLPSPTEALLVPRSAVLQTGERSLVFVRAGDGSLIPRLVRVGLTTGNEVEIVAGLDPGEVVVSSANFLIDAESNLAASVGAPPVWPDGAAGPPPAGAAGQTVPAGHPRH